MIRGSAAERTRSRAALSSSPRTISASRAIHEKTLTLDAVSKRTAAPAGEAAVSQTVPDPRREAARTFLGVDGPVTSPRKSRPRSPRGSRAGASPLTPPPPPSGPACRSAGRKLQRCVSAIGTPTCASPASSASGSSIRAPGTRCAAPS
ncbi:MAG: hypothetical protein MZU95_06785 [Desulfomicrobium escambiense]|nr:hypothetical protein [Desulfomicrobium escambiense]